MDSFSLNGKTFRVALPDFATRDDLVSAAAQEGTSRGADRRLWGALVGLCGGDPKGAIRYKAAGYDVLAYGASFYSELRSAGVSGAEVIEVGSSLLASLTQSLFPREAEVEEQAGN